MVSDPFVRISRNRYSDYRSQIFRRYYENGNEGNNNDRSQKMTYEFPPERPTDEEDHRSCNVKPWSEYDGKNKAWWNECGHGKGISSFRVCKKSVSGMEILTMCRRRTTIASSPAP
jgi:hypothetical protein